MVDYSDDDEAAVESDATLGIKEFQADFATSTARVGDGLSLTSRPDAITLDSLSSYTLGPVAQGDNSEGPIKYRWRVRLVGNAILAARENATGDDWGAESQLFIYPDPAPHEIDSAFDQNGRIVVCGERATGTLQSSEVWLYYFDSLTSSFVLTNFGAGRTPRVQLDDHIDTANSDVILFYLDDVVDQLVYRVQRERYLIEHYDAPLNNIARKYLEDVFTTSQNRLQIVYSIRGLDGKYTLGVLTSTLFPYFTQDDRTKVAIDLQALALVTVVIDYSTTADEMKAGAALNSIALVLVTSSYSTEVDSMQAAAVLSSITLVTVLIVHDLYDHDDMKAGATLNSITLVTALIVHDLYDHDDMKAGVTLNSITLV